MGRKMSRQFCQWDSLKTSFRNTISLESKFFNQGLKKYLSLKISNFNIKNIWPLKNILRTLRDVKSNFGQLLFSTPIRFFHSYLSYRALKISENIWNKKFCLFFQSPLAQIGVEKSNWSRKQKLSEIWFYISKGP